MPTTNMPEILARLQTTFDAIFLDPVTVTPELCAADVKEWDSLLHISIVLSVESEFGIRFRVGEVESAQNVGQFAGLIEKHLREKNQQ